MIAALALSAAIQPSFAGVDFGASAQSVVTRLGDPAYALDDSGGKRYAWLVDGFAHEYVTVFFTRNSVSEVVVTRSSPSSDDPIGALGVKIGAPEKTMASLPAPDTDGLIAGDGGLLYHFTAEDGIVHKIFALLPKDVRDALPAAPAALIHGGTSFADALVIGATSETTGVAAEYAYLDLNDCGPGGHWKSKGQSLATDKGKPYDVLDAVCTVGGAERTFYFDISRYFGKL